MASTSYKSNSIKSIVKCHPFRGYPTTREIKDTSLSLRTKQSLHGQQILKWPLSPPPRSRRVLGRPQIGYSPLRHQPDGQEQPVHPLRVQSWSRSQLKHPFQPQRHQTSQLGTRLHPLAVHSLRSLRSHRHLPQIRLPKRTPSPIQLIVVASLLSIYLLNHFDNMYIKLTLGLIMVS